MVPESCAVMVVDAEAAPVLRSMAAKVSPLGGLGCGIAMG